VHDSPRTVADVVATLRALPPGTSMMAAAVADWLEPLATEAPGSTGPTLAVAGDTADWRTRLWTVPASTRLSVAEVAEGVNRSRDWVYRAGDRRRAAKKGREPLPCSRIDGMLVFTAGDVRAWLQRSEQLINPPRTGG
jgi:hypothetical protein